MDVPIAGSDRAIFLHSLECFCTEKSAAGTNQNVANLCVCVCLCSHATNITGMSISMKVSVSKRWTGAAVLQKETLLLCWFQIKTFQIVFSF